MVLTLGMAALGALLGVMIAWSASPVVATVIPLLFGLVGGAGSFSLLKMDLAKPAAQQKLQTHGASLLACCSACLITLVIAVLTSGYVRQAIDREALAYPLSKEQLANPASAIDRLMLRRRLVAIGASDSEIGGIMSAGPTADFKTAADAIGKAVAVLLAGHDQLQTPDQQKVDAAPDFARLVLSARYFALLNKDMDPSTPIREESFRLLTNKLLEIDLSKALPADPATAKIFTDHPSLVAAIGNLSEALAKSPLAPDLSLRISNMDDLIRLTAAVAPSSKSGNQSKFLTGFSETREWTSK